ncbi:hypothetical protein KKI24_27090 [bacterium]|nr:hypothetical protein [bacterium]
MCQQFKKRNKIQWLFGFILVILMAGGCGFTDIDKPAYYRSLSSDLICEFLDPSKRATTAEERKIMNDELEKRGDRCRPPFNRNLLLGQ